MLKIKIQIPKGSVNHIMTDIQSTDHHCSLLKMYKAYTYYCTYTYLNLIFDSLKFESILQLFQVFIIKLFL